MSEQAQDGAPAPLLPPPPPPPPEDMLVARQAALFVLNQVLERHRPLDQVLEREPFFKEQPVRDRAFIRMLTATSLRRLGQIDDFIRRASARPENPKPPALRNILRLGAAQIAFMDVPDYAVVDTSVRLAEQSDLGRQKGFVNAILRRIAADHKEWIGHQDEGRLNTPEWLLKSWIADYGLCVAGKIAQANLTEAPLDITVKNPDMRKYWAKMLEASIFPTGTLRRAAGGAVRDLPGFDEGAWWVQDAAASLPAQLCGDVAGKTVVDLCAAPGGKTAQLAARGAKVIAVDRSTARIKRLEENLHRLQLENNVKMEIADASVWQPAERASCVLLDAPCTATGTMRRHPDIPHMKTLQDMRNLAGLQTKLLENAATMLAPGGILIYCTCSLQKAEGEDRITKLFENSAATMARLPVTPEEVGDIEDLITPDGDVRILPSGLPAHGGMDGFFISRLQRR